MNEWMNEWQRMINLIAVYSNNKLIHIYNLHNLDLMFTSPLTHAPIDEFHAWMTDWMSEWALELVLSEWTLS